VQRQQRLLRGSVALPESQLNCGLQLLLLQKGLAALEKKNALSDVQRQRPYQHQRTLAHSWWSMHCHPKVLLCFTVAASHHTPSTTLLLLLLLVVPNLRLPTRNCSSSTVRQPHSSKQHSQLPHKPCAVHQLDHTSISDRICHPISTECANGCRICRIAAGLALLSVGASGMHTAT
jgi:hypothetical protein